jgi:hypothetical protein
VRKHYRGTKYTRNNIRTVGRDFYAIHVVWQESRRLSLPRISCCRINIWYISFFSALLTFCKTPKGGRRCFIRPSWRRPYIQPWRQRQYVPRNLPINFYTASHPKRQYYSKFHLYNYFEEPVNVTMLSAITRYQQLQTVATDLSQLRNCLSYQDVGRGLSV